MGYFRYFALLLALAANAAALAQCNLFFSPLTAPQLNPNLSSQELYGDSTDLSELTLENDNCKTAHHANKGCFSPFRHESSTNLIQPLSLLLMALGLIGLGLAARIK
jgi:hypothetical protein